MADERFSYRFEADPTGTVTLLRLSGRLDPLAAEELRPEVRRVVDSGGRKFVLDLTQLRYVGSVGIQVFVELANKVRAEGFVAFAAPDANVRSVLDLTRITQRIPVYPTPSEAIDAARSR